MDQFPAIKDYEIKKEILPAGGWANVYLANYKGNIVALKVFKKIYGDKPDVVKGFFDEAKTLKKFDMPNIVRVINIGDENLSPFYFTMEYYPKGNLDNFIKKNKVLPIDNIIDIVTQICYALDSINREGFLHLDLKPSNILFGEQNQVVLTDFGSSVNLIQLSENELRTGTPQYMSPEQFQPGKELSFYSDLYSLGVIMYYMSCGTLPFNSNDLRQFELMHNLAEPIHPRDHNPSINKNLEKIIEKLLAKKPEDRYQTALSVVNDLKKIKYKFQAFAVKIEQLEENGKIIKTRNFSKFPVLISNLEDTKSQFQLHFPIPPNNYIELLKSHEEVIELKDHSEIGIKLNGQNYIKELVVIDSKTNNIQIGDNRLRLHKIPVKDKVLISRLSFAFILLFISCGLFAIILHKLDHKTIIAISELKIIPDIVAPGDMISVDYNIVSDSNMHIAKTIIAPYGKDKSFIEVSGKQNIYKYDYDVIKNNISTSFLFALKVFDETGRESNWIEKEITIRDYSQNLIINGLKLPDEIYINKSVQLYFETMTDIPKDDIFVQVKEVSDGKLLKEKNFNLTDISSRNWIFNTEGISTLILQAYTKDGIYVSRPIQKQINIKRNTELPKIIVTEYRIKDNKLVFSYEISDCKSPNDSLKAALFINNNYVSSINTKKDFMDIKFNKIENFFIEVSAPDGRKSRSTLIELNNNLQNVIKFTSTPRIKNLPQGKRKLRFTYSIDDAFSFSTSGINVFLKINNNDERLIDEQITGEYDNFIEEDGDVNIQLFLYKGKKLISQSKKAFINKNN